jgi:hypothetical protein
VYPPFGIGALCARSAEEKGVDKGSLRSNSHHCNCIKLNRERSFDTTTSL